MVQLVNQPGSLLSRAPTVEPGTSSTVGSKGYLNSYLQKDVVLLCFNTTSYCTRVEENPRYEKGEESSPGEVPTTTPLKVVRSNQLS
jgi:hypothetical protein